MRARHGVPRRQRLLRVAAALAVSLLLLLIALISYLRRDPTDEILETRGRYEEGLVLERWREKTGATVRRVALANERGDVVSEAYVRIPDSPSPDYRLVVIYSGVTTGARVLELIPDRRDVVLVAPQYPLGEPPRGLDERLEWLSAVRDSSFRTVAGGMLAVSHLRREHEFDTDRVVVIAASLGSIFGTIHAAIDERIERLVVVHGGGDIPLVIGSIFEREDEELVGSLVVGVAWALVGALDPVHWIDEVSPREVLMIVTRRDRYFPPRSVEALWEAAREPKEIVWTETDHVGSDPSEVAADIVARIETYLDATG